MPRPRCHFVSKEALLQGEGRRRSPQWQTCTEQHFSSTLKGFLYLSSLLSPPLLAFSSLSSNSLFPQKGHLSLPSFPLLFPFHLSFFSCDCPSNIQTSKGHLSLPPFLLPLTYLPLSRPAGHSWPHTSSEQSQCGRTLLPGGGEWPCSSANEGNDNQV